MLKLVSEDTLKQTPRSQLNSDGTTYGDQSPDSSSPPGSFSDSKCEDELLPAVSDNDDDDEEDDGEGTHHEDDYYAFLRELAGSFEACEDDESEVGSESDGSSDEDEGSGAISRKRSSADDNLGNGLPASPAFRGHGLAHGVDNLKEESAKASNSFGAQCTPVQPPSGGYPANTTACFRGPMPPLICAAALPGADVPEDVADVSRKRMLTSSDCRARLDTRPPVVDDYDVVKATVDYDEQRGPLSCADRQREELMETINLRKDQATKLLAISGRQHIDPELRSHYAHIRSELLVEVRILEEQMDVLVEETLFRLPQPGS